MDHVHVGPGQLAVLGPGVTDQGTSRVEGHLGGSSISLADATVHDWTRDTLLTRGYDDMKVAGALNEIAKKHHSGASVAGTTAIIQNEPTLGVHRRNTAKL